MVDCTLDEIVGVALALNRAIAIPEDLFDGTTVRCTRRHRRVVLPRLTARLDTLSCSRVM